MKFCQVDLSSRRMHCSSNLYQRGNRIQLDGLQILQHIVEFKSSRLTLSVYYTKGNTGNSYNLRPLGENLDLAFKDHATWFNDYKNAYLTFYPQW